MLIQRKFEGSFLSIVIRNASRSSKKQSFLGKESAEILRKQWKRPFPICKCCPGLRMSLQGAKLSSNCEIMSKRRLNEVLLGCWMTNTTTLNVTRTLTLLLQWSSIGLLLACIRDLSEEVPIAGYRMSSPQAIRRRCRTMINVLPSLLLLLKLRGVGYCSAS
jgi:hypothetical protein